MESERINFHRGSGISAIIANLISVTSHGVGPTPVVFHNHIDPIGVERKNILYWLGGKTERLRNIHALYNLALFRLAALQCIHIVDVTSPMLAHAHFDELLEQDGVTLSPAGEALVNDELASLSSRLSVLAS